MCVLNIGALFVGLCIAKQTLNTRRINIARSVVLKMSRKESVICDVCGSEISPYRTKEESAQIRLFAPNEYRGAGGQRIDLCLVCYEGFVTFLESGAKMDGKENKQ